MDRKELIKQVKPHLSYITTVKEWDDYAEKHNLPSSMVLIRTFGSWNKFKKALQLPIKNSAYSRSQLEQIARQYKEHFSRKAKWDDFSRKHGLPSSMTYINTFGSWNRVKEFLGIQNEKKKADIYSKEDIYAILRQHAEHYESRKQWDEYAKEHKLPTYKTIRKHYEYEEILNIVGKEPKEIVKYTKEDLFEIACEHRHIFMNASYRFWNKYASTNKLPSAYRYYREFGTWKKAKEEVEKFLNEKFK